MRIALRRRREDGDGTQQSGAAVVGVYRWPDLLDEHDGEAEDLNDSVEFAEQAGAEVAQGASGEEQGGDEQDAEVAAEDEDRDVTRHEVHVGEHEEERAEQQLVGDGVQILAEGGALREPSGEEAIEAVREAGEDEEARRRGGSVHRGLR